MKGKTRPNLAKIIRIGVAASLFLVVIIISLYFMIRSKKQPKYSRESKEITQQKVEKKEQIVHFEVKGEKGNFLIRANKHYAGEDNNYYLEGKVEIVDFGKEEGEDISIYGEEVVYDKDMIHFVLTGQSTVKYKDLIIKSDFLDYDKEKEVFKSDKGVQFSSRQLSGSAQKMVYSMRKKIIKLRQKIHLQLIPRKEDTLPLIVKGQKLEYNRRNRVGEVTEEVELFQGKNQASARVLKFLLSKDEEFVKSITLVGNVRATLVEEKKEGGKREIEADEIFLHSFKKVSRVSRVKAKGNCCYRFFSASGNFIQVQGETLDFLFDLDGELKEFNALTLVRMVEQKKDSGEKRIIEGAELRVDGKTNVLQVKGSDKLGAKVTSQDFEVLAQEVKVHLEKDNIEAKTEVKVVFKSRGEKESIGFFSQEKPVFITSQELKYSKDKKRFLFDKEVKVWQQKEMLFADELSLFEETGKILCSGKVKSVFFHKQKEKEKEERIEISADKMNFNQKKNLISYNENGSLKVTNILLRGQSIVVHLNEEGKMETIVAQEKVSIVREDTEGKGEMAKYDVGKETIALTGNPVVVDKERGMTRGDKLTFYIGDGRIIVENKEQERSITVIKS